MELIEAISKRTSVRNYLPEPVPQEVLEQILEAGRLAPSAQNRQPWRYIVIQGMEQTAALAKHCGLIGLSNYFIKTAPLVIVACADTKANTRINGMDYYLVDTAISFQQMILCATSYGLGSCWMAAYSEKTLKKYLVLPPSWKVVAISPFGYPAETKTLYGKVLSVFSGSKDRLPLSKTVRYRSDVPK